MAKKETQELVITPPNFQEVNFTIEGTAPYVQNKFSAKAKEKLKQQQQAGSTTKSRKVREAKDFEEACKGASYISKDGWYGIPTSNFRAAMVAACRTVGYKMTHAKLAFFIEADGFDHEDQSPLVKITKGEPTCVDSLVRIQQTVDLRARPFFPQGWEATVRIVYDGDMFTTSDILNLLARVGTQVGVGEGRPNSKSSTGMGWGTFKVKEQ